MTNREPMMVIVAPAKNGVDDDFDDNVFGPCARCGQRSYWRPHAPPFPKICSDCWMKERTPDDVNMVTPQVLEDLRRWAQTKVEAERLRRKP